MRCRVPTLLCALLLVCAPMLGAVPAAGQPQVDGTHLKAQLQADGDAAWNVTVSVPIESDSDREAFEAFADRFEANEGGLELGVDAFERAASEASAASGREMAITSVSRHSEVVTDSEGGDTHGILRVSFTWESFARIDDEDTLYVDDAFNTTDGTWLPGLGAEQSLTILAPPGYGGPTTSPIGADGGDLTWEGPATFEPGYFNIVYHPSSAGPTTDGMSDTLVIGALLLSGAALLVGLYLLFARRNGNTSPGEGGAITRSGPDNGERGDGTTAGPADTTGVAEPSGQDDEDADPGAGTDEPDPELLSDEERVEYLLEQNGGRMKQATIVKETGWSNAKVSQLLSSMDDENRVDKLRIGRENLISLPGEGVGELDDGT
ncbi:MAG: hypothetical protein ACI9TI_000111 [Natronomonas sp.]|jgi:hypothetical protein|uniref:helix-turn-helix transcriptional regulator n=1 Tax=Natronomonas sp. TaxID=2184060 RepID=UPI003988A64E